MLTDEQIKYMRDRFLGWKLPETFNPDNGISFKSTFNDHLDPPMKRDPSGTNLFDARQAEQMIHYMLDGMQRAATMHNDEAERVGFEGWVSDSQIALNLERHMNGYKYAPTECAWEAWRARAALAMVQWCKL